MIVVKYILTMKSLGNMILSLHYKTIQVANLIRYILSNIFQNIIPSKASSISTVMDLLL